VALLKPVNVVKTVSCVNYEDCVASDVKWRRMQNRISGLLARVWRLLELKIKHKHGGFNINYEKATVVWQQFGYTS
jgi:hypothetical protein